MGHDVETLPAAITAAADGTPVAAWVTGENGTANLYAARVAGADTRPLRVNPDGLRVDSVHQSPGLAAGPGGEIYVTWSTRRPGDTTAMASDLSLSRSLDGGRTFDRPPRVNDDRPIYHSFEGVTVARDGTALVSWIDGREGPHKSGTYLAHVVERGARVAGVSRLDDTTCPCCRVALATGPGETVLASWRRVLPGDVRDMVVGASNDGGRTFAPATVVHDDRWKITACPHRGASLGLDARGRAYIAWYTEGPDGQPKILAAAENARRFGEPVRLNASAGSIPDHPRLAVAPGGAAVVVWEEATAEAIKAWAPDLAIAPGGGFVVAWHEERYPQVKTVVRRLHVDAAR